MKQFTKILVHVDTDAKKHHALSRAVDLAAAGGALKAIDVVADLPSYLEAPAFGYPALSETLAKEKRERLEKILEPYRRKGVAIESEVFYGKPAIEIIREVIRNGHDLVMRAAEPGGLARLFGASGMQLLRKCPCPVWVVKPARRGVPRILAAIDPQSGQDEENALNRKIVELALEVERLGGGKLHLVHAWNSFGSASYVRSSLTAEQSQKFSKLVHKQAKSSLANFLASFDVKFSTKRVHLMEGDPSAVIVDLTRDLKIDLLVMGTVVRTGIQGFLMGNTAETVLGRVNCSVLAVKPDGFVCPVKLDSE